VKSRFRRVPAVTLAKQLIDEGRLGRVDDAVAFLARFANRSLATFEATR
jgi:predicted dehydrogenase